MPYDNHYENHEEENDDISLENSQFFDAIEEYVDNQLVRLEFSIVCPNASEATPHTARISLARSNVNPQSDAKLKSYCFVCNSFLSEKERRLIVSVLKEAQERLIDSGDQTELLLDGQPIYGDDYSVENLLTKLTDNTEIKPLDDQNTGDEASDESEHG